MKSVVQERHVSVAPAQIKRRKVNAHFFTDGGWGSFVVQNQPQLRTNAPEYAQNCCSSLYSTTETYLQLCANASGMCAAEDGDSQMRRKSAPEA